MSESSRFVEEPKNHLIQAYPLQVDNRFSLMGYTTAVIILLVATALELDGLTYTSVLWYGALGITFHACLEVAGRKRWVSKRVHSVAYELIGMLVWIVSFAYAATLLDNLRPLLLVSTPWKLSLISSFAALQSQEHPRLSEFPYCSLVGHE